MCAQYMIKATLKDLALRYGLHLPEETLSGVREDSPWEERIFPHRQAPVITRKGVQLMNFSLIPSWSPTSRPKFATHNARIETVQEKATWKKPFLKNHCLVPLTAFYEPIYEGPWGPNMVRFQSSSSLTAAGLWDHWIDQHTGESKESFAILTQEPCEFIRKVGHDRQPLFLSQNQSLGWLDYQSSDYEATKEYLRSICWADPSFEVEIDRPLKASPKR